MFLTECNQVRVYSYVLTQQLHGLINDTMKLASPTRGGGLLELPTWRALDDVHAWAWSGRMMTTGLYIYSGIGVSSCSPPLISRITDLRLSVIDPLATV